MKTVSIVAVMMIIYSCGNQNDTPENIIVKKNESDIISRQKKNDSLILFSKVKKNLINDLVDIQGINSTILVELKYATSDNFMKMKLYAHMNKAYLQKDVALRLSECQEYLTQMKPGFKLLVFDAVRPVSVQQKMWDALDSIPPVERGKFVSNPKNRSLHNLGAAIDLTICDENGKPLDMGAGYDDIRKIAYPEMESFYLKSGDLTTKQIENRELLRNVMRKEGFRNIPTEWWHFNACSRSEALKKYKILFEEP